MAREKVQYTLEELRRLMGETAPNRQHGRIGVECEDEEAEFKRLYNNYKSRESRRKKRELLKDKAKRVVLYEDAIEDDDGITARDRRRYNLCFTAGIQGIPVERDYVKRMTGLNDVQIDILAAETGLQPAVSISW